LIFEGGIDFLGGLRKVAKVRDLGIKGALECSHTNFVLVANIEKSEGAFFVQPLFELSGRNLWGWVAGGVDARNPKADDFFFNFDEHALEGLGRAGTLFGTNLRKAWCGAEELKDGIELVASS